ncbi:MAG: nascent polypeptide-associated complex protein [Methanomassiliicoccales archaeon]|nr:nascent polypeptide-associated complex protein [Methanomassiliicoccales archaeon]
MPGMRGVNPRQVKQAMKRMGIETEELQGVTEVIIRTKDKEYQIKDAEVTIMKVQGQKTFQVVGEEKVVPLGQSPAEKTAAPAAAIVPEEDVQLVMSQTGASREKAIEALNACDGQPAEAIIRLMS